MKSLDLSVFLSVFAEMLGPFLWLIVAVAVLGTAAFILVVVRDRGLSSRRLVRSELVGIVGGFAAVLFMQAVTHSGFGDVGGPIDWLLIALIWMIGAGGATVLSYGVLGLMTRRGDDRRQS